MASSTSLRPVLDSDVAVFCEQRLDPLAMTMADVPSRDREACRARWEKILSDEEVTSRTIVCRGLVAGHVVSWRHQGQHLVGYWLGREFWGRGVATRALELFLGVVAARPLYAHVATHNAGSIRVLEKCGFDLVVEGEGLSGGGGEGVTAGELIFRLE